MDELLTFVISSVTGLVSFFVGQKRARRETESVYLKNIEHSISIYQTIIKDLKAEMEGMMEKIDKLESKVDELVKENKKLEKIVKEYQNANTDTKSV
jgi:peptidoglycan hydrolase CwlO-like protein